MAKDKLHSLVEIALIKDGWVNIESTALKYRGTDLNLDIIADKLISAEKENIQIAVEVKSFGNPSITYDFPFRARSILKLPHGTHTPGY